MRGLETTRQKVRAVLVFALAAGGLTKLGVAAWRCLGETYTSMDILLVLFFGMAFICLPVWFLVHRRFMLENLPWTLAAVATAVAILPAYAFFDNDEIKAGVESMNDSVVRDIAGFFVVLLFMGIYRRYFKMAETTFNALLVKEKASAFQASRESS